MAFTVNDFRDLLEILRTMPDWKEALRRELLGEEILMLPRLVRELIKAVEEMSKRLYRVEQDVEVLKADVEVLKADVEVLKADVATLKGDSLERKYRERPFVYFRRIVRKSKVLTDSEIEELLSQAQANGALSEADVDEISRLDVIVRGRRITDDSVAYLAVEVSAKIDDYDVERAVRRAKLLAKIPGVVAIPVVAGEQLAPEGRRALKQTAAWAVVDGSAIESTSPAI
jgi:hypothetical protein